VTGIATGWRSGESGGSEGDHAEAGATGESPGCCVAGGVDGPIDASPEAAQTAAGSLDGVADDNGISKSASGPGSMGRSGRARMPTRTRMPYARSRRREYDCHGGGGQAGDHRERRNSATGACLTLPSSPQSRGLSPSSSGTTSAFTDEDTSSSDSDQHTPFLNGAEAWARCWRLAPQGAEWGAGHLACVSASTLDSEMSEEGAAVDRARGGEADGAAAGIIGMGEAGSESVQAKNAGDGVDIVLHELPIRYAADRLSCPPLSLRLEATIIMICGARRVGWC
jgi:hypothetical protein